MTYSLINKCAKNYYNRTFIVPVIAKNVVTCFFLRHSVGYVFIYMFLSLELSDFDQINVLKRRNVFHEPICWILMLPKSRSGSENGKYRRRSLLAFTVLSLHTLSVAFLKHTVSSRFTASGSAKCLKFGNWLTMCTLNIALTYLLITYL